MGGHGDVRSLRSTTRPNVLRDLCLYRETFAAHTGERLLWCPNLGHEWPSPLAMPRTATPAGTTSDLTWLWAVVGAARLPDNLATAIRSYAVLESLNRYIPLNK